MESQLMTIFDLLFVLVFLASVVTLLGAMFAGLRGQKARAIAILRRLGLCAAIYLGVVVIVSLVSPRRVLKVGDDLCWDDWCMTVTNVRKTPSNGTVNYLVTFRVSSRARRRPQRGFARVYMMDDRGGTYDPVPDPGDTPFEHLLHPREAISATRVFALPADAQDPVIVMSHGGSFPGNFIIGDSESLLHKRTVVRFDHIHDDQ
jgi:hypothetical protein